MNLFGMMDISSSALRAERVRAEVVASNMANAETTRTEDGGPYRRHHVVFAAASSQTFGTMLNSQIATPGGVSVAGVVEDQSAALKRFDPGHPDAGPDGYVSYPDINPLTEMVDLMGAQRAYGMNASAVQAEKGMVSASLDILK
jgi:flagellar basal-body rod protein FlgC